MCVCTRVYVHVSLDSHLCLAPRLECLGGSTALYLGHPRFPRRRRRRHRLRLRLSLVGRRRRRCLSHLGHRARLRRSGRELGDLGRELGDLGGVTPGGRLQLGHLGYAWT